MYPYTFKVQDQIFKIIDLTNEITSQTNNNYILLSKCAGLSKGTPDDNIL